jgi:tetratricopeptide (TPR) repeat protein
MKGLSFGAVVRPATILAAVLFAGAATAATKQEWDQCSALDSPDVAIPACTRIIEARGATVQDRAAAYGNRGMAYDTGNDQDRAMADLNESIRLDPKDANAYNGRGNAYRNRSDDDHALADYNEAIRLNPKYAEPRNNRGNVYKDRGDNDRAIAEYNEAIRLNPKFVIAYNGRGSAYLNKGDTDHALADYNEAIRLDPKYAQPYSNRGVIYKNKGDLDRAIADFNEAIRLNPKFSMAYGNRGDAYKNKGDFDRAIADFNEAIRLNPKDAKAYNVRGLTYEAKGDLDRAIADFGQLIALRQNADAYNRRCWARALAGTDLQGGALADCNEALRLAPNAGYIFNSRGLVQLKLGAFAQAINDYSAAIAQDGRDADSLYGRGIAKMKSGDTAGGDADIAAAKTIKPDIAEVYAGYGVKAQGATSLNTSQVAVAAPPEPPSSPAGGQSNSGNRSPPEAATPQDYADCQQSADAARSIAACRRVASDPAQSTADRAVAYRWLGNDHVAGGALDEAIGAYSEAIRLEPQNAASYASRAIVNLQKGNRTAAIADYRQAVTIDPVRIGGMVAGSAELADLAKSAVAALDATANPAPASSAAAGGQAESVNRSGAVSRGWIGVKLETMSDAKAESLNVKPPRGALIGGLFDSGPAKSAGVALNDVVVKFDGQDVKAPSDLVGIVAQTPVGKAVDVVVVRYGREETLRLTVGRLDDGGQAAANPAPAKTQTQTLGLELSSLSDDLREKFKVRYDVHGVIITGVDANTAASADAHLAPGDVIVELQFQTITDPAGIQIRIDQLKGEGKKAALLLVHKPDGANHYVAVRLQ